MRPNKIFSSQNLTIYGFGVAIGSLIKQLTDAKVQSKVNEATQAKLSGLENQVKDSVEKLNLNIAENQTTNSFLQKMRDQFTSKFEHVTSSMDKTTQSSSKIQEMVELLKNPNLSEQEKVEKFNELCNNINDHIECLDEFKSNIDTLNMSIELFKKNNSSYMDPFLHFTKSFEDFIANLDLMHTFALVHILGSLSLIFILFSMITIFYGDYLIRRFELEVKYPKLAKWIQLRRNLQNYSLIWNLSLAFGVIITILILNAWIFIFN